MKKVGRVMNHQLILKGLGLASSGVEYVSQLFTVQQIDGESTQVSGLESPGEFLRMEVQLNPSVVQRKVVDPGVLGSLHLQYDLSQNGFQFIQPR